MFEKPSFIDIFIEYNKEKEVYKILFESKLDIGIYYQGEFGKYVSFEAKEEELEEKIKQKLKIIKIEGMYK